MEEELSLASAGAARLVARLGLVEDACGGLVICHPHPLYGGDMDNPVVVRAAEVAREARLSTLRFNFRGVGGSTGSHGAGDAEVADARAALAALAPRLAPKRPLGLAGYSFGAWVAARVATEERGLGGLGLIAPPLAMLDWSGLDGGGGAVLLVAGSRDTYCPVGELDRLAARFPGAERVVIDGADHFLFGKLLPLGEAISGWIGRWSGG